MIGGPNPLFIAIGFFLIMFGAFNLMLSAPGSVNIDIEHHVSFFCIFYGLIYIIFVVVTENLFTGTIGFAAGSAINMIVFFLGLLAGLYLVSTYLN